MSNKKKQIEKKTDNSIPVVNDPVVAVNPDMQVWGKIFTASLLLVFVLMGIMSFGYGLSGDEVDMNEYGKAILRYFTTFGADDTVLHLPRSIDRDGVLMYYGGFFDLVCAVVNKFSPFEEYTTRHILNAWAGFIAIYFSARITALLADKRIATLNKI